MAFLIFILGFMVVRLAFVRSDRPLGWPTILIMAMAQSLWLGLFSWQPSLIALMALLWLALLASEKMVSGNWLNESRLAGLVVVAIVASELLADVTFAPWLLTIVDWCHQHTQLFQAATEVVLMQILWIATGILLLANEVNLIIRILFHRFALEPVLVPQTLDERLENLSEPKLDQKEYNAGRVIGILERWLMYAVIVATAEYSAVAFILAAKGVARFKQLEEREFAEYVLVGTLASTLLTILVAGVIRQFL